MMNKTIIEEILNKWLKMNADHLECKGSIMAHEFLYLVCNAVDRPDFVLNFSYFIMTIASKNTKAKYE